MEDLLERSRMEPDLVPTRIVMLSGKDPRLMPARTYFNHVLGWGNVSSVFISAQNARASDYTRIYGGCNDRVLAFSSTYAAFEGFDSQEEQTWLERRIFPALWTDKSALLLKAQHLAARLRKDTGSFSCIHLTELDTAVLGPRASPGNPGTLDSEADPSIDVAEPAAQSVPFGAQVTAQTLRQPLSVCDAYDAEGVDLNGRQWVRMLAEQGFACHVNEDVISSLGEQLPPRDPVFVLADGHRALPESVVEVLSAKLRSEFINIGVLTTLAGTDVPSSEWPTLEQQLCAQADTLLLNRFSPLSHIIQRRAYHYAERASKPAAVVLSWMKTDSDSCVALFTKTARFDIQPNRFGILGQFGPDRKLQLMTTNVSSIIDWDGKVIPNASIELDVYVTNASHPLHIFEFTKENNLKGISLKIPAPTSGWIEHMWHHFSLPIGDSAYSYPMSTPWDRMDRLELYYLFPHPAQSRSDYIRVRNVFLRSRRTFVTGRQGLQVAAEPCKDAMRRDFIRQTRLLSSVQAVSVSSDKSIELSEATSPRALSAAVEAPFDESVESVGDREPFGSQQPVTPTTSRAYSMVHFSIASMAYLSIACLVILVLGGIILVLACCFCALGVDIVANLMNWRDRESKSRPWMPVSLRQALFNRAAPKGQQGAA